MNCSGTSIGWVLAAANALLMLANITLLLANRRIRKRLTERVSVNMGSFSGSMKKR